MGGCLGNLYESIENLNETYIQPNQNKKSVLNPKSPLYVSEIPLLISDHESKKRKFYACPNYKYSHSLKVAEEPNLLCPECNAKMNYEASYYVPPMVTNNETVADGGGFVKGVVTYMVMDNLDVTPLSAISAVTLLNKFNVEDVSNLQEKVVNLGVNEGLKLLKASWNARQYSQTFS